MDKSFTIFGLSHILGLLVTAGLMLLARFSCRLSQDFQIKLAKFLGIFLLSFLPFFQAYHLFVEQNWQLKYHLPLQISNLIILFLGLGFLSCKPVWSRLSVFWAIPGGLVSVLSPDLKQDFPHINYWFFWISHAIMLAMVSFLIQYRHLSLKYKDVLISSAVFVIYACLIYLVNNLLGSNYGYINQPPDNLHTQLIDWGIVKYYQPTLVGGLILVFHLVFLGFKLSPIFQANFSSIRPKLQL